MSLLSSQLPWYTAGVKRLAKLGMVKDAPGMSALDMNTAEDMIVRNTREVVPGMVICGMEVRYPPASLDRPKVVSSWTGVFVEGSDWSTFSLPCQHLARCVVPSMLCWQNRS